MIVLVVGSDRVDAGKRRSRSACSSEPAPPATSPARATTSGSTTTTVSVRSPMDDCTAKTRRDSRTQRDASGPRVAQPGPSAVATEPRRRSGLFGRADREFRRQGRSTCRRRRDVRPKRHRRYSGDRRRRAPRGGDSDRDRRGVRRTRKAVIRPRVRTAGDGDRRRRDRRRRVLQRRRTALQALDPASVAAVAAVEPGRARIYRGDRYCRACEIASSSAIDGRLEKRVPDVLEYLDPLERVGLPALGSDRRSEPERIARAYDEAYDALLEAARETVGR